MSWTRALACAALAAVCGSCEHVDADHPLDPETPLAEQATAEVEGRLLLPADAFADALEDSLLRLLPADGRPQSSQVQTGVDADGTFRFTRVQPGDYLLEFQIPGFVLDPRLLQLTAGATVALGDIGVQRVSQPTTAVVAGVARLSGAETEGHAGILVSSATGFSTTTGPTGRFRLELTAGTTTLSFAKLGYVTAEVEAEGVTAGETTDLGMAVTLEPMPGEVEGTVGLRRFETPLRLGAVSVRLVPGNNTLSERATVPDDRGRYSVEGVTPGPYTLEISAAGYLTRSLPVDAEPGGLTQAGLVELPHASEGGSAVRFEGRVVMRDDAESPAGTRVEIVLSGSSLLLDTPLADIDGFFDAAAARDEAYRVRVDRDGFAPVDIGPFRYDARADRFVDDSGRPPEPVLAAGGAEPDAAAGSDAGSDDAGVGADAESDAAPEADAAP